MEIYGISQTVYKGILVETLSPKYALINPALYQAGIAAGGAFAAYLPSGNINFPGVDVRQHQIVLLETIVASLTEDELGAVLEHEKSHIDNTEEEMQGRGSMKIPCSLQYELRADSRGAHAFGAAAMRDGILKMRRKQLQLLFPQAPSIVISALVFLDKFTAVNKRMKALNKMIAQGL